MAEVMTHPPWSVFQSPVALMAKVFQDGTDYRAGAVFELFGFACSLTVDG